MANRAYLGLWLREFSEATMLAHFERFLAAAPLSPTSPLTELVIQAVDSSEPTLAEWDLRGQGFGVPDLVELARDHVHADVSYLVGAQWDLWVLEPAVGLWSRSPLPLTILCQGPDYDSNAWAELGHFHVDLGFEHLFTGHAGVLNSRPAAAVSAEAAGHDGSASNANTGPAVSGHVLAEKAFSAWIARGEHLLEYHEKTRENIQQVFSWVRGLEEALPVESIRLWSEGEENFEARLDEILARR
jgi:hypothetical protein